MDLHDVSPCIIFQPLMVSKVGYPVETHQVITDDGYILRMHRIPHGKRSPRTNIERPAVYVQHGIESSSADWLVAGPKKALGNDRIDGW